MAATSFINQGYIFCTVTLCLLMLIRQVLKSTTDLKDTGLFTARLLGLGVLGLFLYLGFTYPVCQVMGIPLGNYAGADNFGGFSATTSLSLSKLLWARLGGYIPAVFLYICGSGQIMSQAV